MNGVPLHISGLATVDFPASAADVGAANGGVFIPGSHFAIRQAHPNGAITNVAKFIFVSDNGVLSAWTERHNASGTFGRPVDALTGLDDSVGGSSFFGLAILPASDGLLFNDPGNGNCQSCHPTARGADGSFPLFTDFSFNKLGVPRNAAIVRNDEPGYFDLGLCARADLAARAGLCDAFKVRHAAQRGAALCVLPQRALQQPEGRGHVCDAPALREAEVDDVIAFLKIPIDGYRP